ncbi:MAG: phosphoribosylglycinamide formyltransferase [Elusimicrobia bacterium]|nr:phosphoribosylglycinamide formyltransferase [Elusimicrobiota bacterium]
MVRMGVLVSGSGTNLQVILDAYRTKKLNAKVSVVISNKKDAFALQRAKRYNIKIVFIDPKKYDFDKKAIEVLEKQKVDLVCLAGFLLKLKKRFIRKYKGRILNIHPALLPKFGGKGMYGLNVHKAVLQAGEKISGCTVHLVDEKYDHGKIILQKKVKVLKDDTAATLQKRVLKQEHKLYPEAIKLFIKELRNFKGATETHRKKHRKNFSEVL